jgi:hypothetical protein
MKASWIRRYFMRKDDYTLWCYFIVVWTVQITVGFTVITAIAVKVFL